MAQRIHNPPDLSFFPWLSVYIETTITGHLTSRLPGDTEIAGQMLTTRRWWKDERHRFELFTSILVHEEASQGDAVAASERLKIIADIPLVPTNDIAVKLADELLAHAALPFKARVDALHLGTATANGIDFLLTWNCGTWLTRFYVRKLKKFAGEQVLSRRSFARPMI